MPELPEVETVRRTLAPAVGMKVVGVTTSGKPLRLGKEVRRTTLLRALSGHRIKEIRRRGKYLLVDTTGRSSVLVHLGMSGRFRLLDAKAEVAPHTHVTLALTKGRKQWELRYSDPRRFGFVELVPEGGEELHPSLSILGPDPLVDGLSVTQFLAKAKGRRTSLKAFLLDQRVVAGIGNIYASEALWRAQIRPTTQASALSAPRAELLCQAVRSVLDHALDHGGTTLKDFVAADGSYGEHSGYLSVYGRDGEPCPRECGAVIKKTVLQGRSTFHCPTCQKR